MSDRRRLTVDEIELNADNERVAVLIDDDGSQLVLPLALLPEGTRVGDVLNLSLAPDADETQRRRKRVKDLQKKLFGDR
ncbi:MAG TPA: DUF3006 domain-containing protein [Thermomicrobiales bacterium]|nr:DUF3006 domain-containing protein [Thermomicrobiales bacterium]